MSSAKAYVGKVVSWLVSAILVVSLIPIIASACGSHEAKANAAASTVKIKTPSVTYFKTKTTLYTFKWNKVSDASGYQYRYSRHADMSIAAYGNTGRACTSKTITKAKSKTKYYVQVRAYKNINGKKVYSSWSTKKSATTKAAKATNKKAAAKSSGVAVYITNTGECYHRSGCTWLRWSKIRTTLSSAKAQGYRACSYCF